MLDVDMTFCKRVFGLCIALAPMTLSLGCGGVSIDAGLDESVFEGTEVTLTATRQSNEEVEDVLWKQLSGPDVELDDPSDFETSFDAPEVSEATELVFEVTAFQNYGRYSFPLLQDSFSLGGDLIIPASSDTITITVLPKVSDVSAGDDITVDELTTVTLVGTAEVDATEVVLSFDWEQISGPTVTLTDETTLRPFFTAPEVSEATELVFRLTVETDSSKTTTDEVSVLVQDVAQEVVSPTANAGSDSVVDEGDSVTLDAVNSSFPTDAEVTYQWEQLDGPDVTLSSSENVQAVFTAPTVGEATLLTFQLTVTLTEHGTSSQDDVVITVTPLSPTASISGDSSKYEGETVSLTGINSSDPNNGSLSYAWETIEIEGSDIVFSFDDAADESVTFTAPTVDESTVVTIQLTVSDEQDSTNSATTTVTILPNTPTSNAGTDQNITEGNNVTLNGTSSSAPIGSVTYEWIVPGGITLSNRFVPNPVFTAPTVTKNTSYTIELRVKSESGKEDSDFVVITVLNS